MNTRPRSIEILLVEDNLVDRLIVVEALAQARVMNTLHWVEDGVEALAFLRREGKFAHAPRPDLILLDLGLPRKDGRDVLRELREEPLFRYLPVIVMTSPGEGTEVFSKSDSPTTGFVAKPVDFDAFARAVRALGTFWFEVVSLPVARPDQPEVPTSESASAPPQPGGHIRVLLVEDNPSDVMLLQAALGRSRTPEFELIVVGWISEAVERLAQPGIDVVLSDLGLPDGMGTEAVRTLRTAAPNVPLIVLTAWDDEEVGLAAMQAGAQDYLVKGDDQFRNIARTLRLTVERARMERLLHQAQRLETVGQLAGGVAHDFNNLLTVINGHVGLIADRPGLDPGIRESLDDISAAVTRATSLTRQLLTFSRQQPVRRRWADLNTIVGDLHKMLGRLIGEHVHIELQLAATLPSVQADVGMMEQVLMNLAVNARDAMPQGGKLTIRTEHVVLGSEALRRHPEARAGDFVCLTMADTGSGIAPDLLKRIFEPFFTTKEPGKGSGLGLATVHGIVRQHEGWVEVESRLGRGTRFKVLLPAGEAPPAAALPAEAHQARVPGAGECLLVAEDEEVLRSVLDTTLRRLGYEVLLAPDGPTALELWHEHRDRIALLVTDIVMPGGMTGVDLVEIILQDEPGLRHIYVSGYSTEFLSGRETFIEGANFLQKPYSLGALTRLVRDRLDEAKDKP